MKKVLSVAMASAMVLGMGANAFAIQYSTSSNDTANWPTNFKFDGSLFVTNKDGDIVTKATTQINDNESVDFDAGDVIWMPLYADGQYAYDAAYDKGNSKLDAVSNIKLGADYFVAGTPAAAQTTKTVDVTNSYNVKLTTTAETEIDVVTKVEINGVEMSKASVVLKNVTADKKSAIAVITVPAEDVAKIEPAAIDLNSSKAQTITVTVPTPAHNAAEIKAQSVTIGQLTTLVAAQTQVPATLTSVPTTIDVIGDTATTARTVSGAKAVVGTKTFTTANMTAAGINDFIAKVNAELVALDKAGKSAQISDVVVTVTLKEVAGTDPVVGKPVIVEGDKITVVGGTLTTDNLLAKYGHYTGNIDKNWSINLIEKSTGVAELIEKAELYKATATDYASYNKYTTEIMPNAVYVKVTLKKDWKTTSSETLKYYVYVANNKANDKKTNEVWVSGKYANSYVRYVNFDWTNDASKAGLWKVRADENGVAVFDFSDKAFFSVKMYAGESMYLDLATAYDKVIAGEMDAEADSFYKFDNTNANFARTGELIIASDDDTLVPYEIDADGNFVAVDAEYVKNYAVAHTNTKVNGFVFNTKQLGNYVLSTEELGEEEVPADEVEEEPADEVEEPAEVVVPETKPNPETGAEDFVGLAVSLAVVSVAAAGALALKK